MSDKLEPNKVIFLRGIPASGKSTYAKELLAKDEYAYFMRVNKDSIRLIMKNPDKDLTKMFDLNDLCLMLHDKRQANRQRAFVNTILIPELVNHFTPKIDKLIKACKAKTHQAKEKWVIEIQDCIIKTLHNHPYGIIVDDTNYNSFHLDRIRSICHDYKFEIIDMHEKFDITIEECIKRNEKRKGDAKVPKVAIYTMAKKAGIGKWANAVKYDKFESDTKYVICDIDGTIADAAHREHFVQGNKKDWKGFFDAMGEDAVHDDVKGMIDYTYANLPIVMVTGRPDSYKALTEKWLKDNDIRYDAIYMRREHDRRSDVEVKQEILDKYLDKSMVEVSIDDRTKVVNGVWRANGINVIHVHPKDF